MKFAVVLLVIGFVGFGSSKVIKNEILASEICFDHYGCFNTKKPWTSWERPIGALPKQPWEVGTRFILFTRGTHETEQIGYEILPDKDAILKFSDFNAERKTYVLIHGFTDTHKVDWLWKTKDLLLQNEDVNIIAVDWLNGARPPYLQATANSRIVGAQIARMIAYLEQKADLSADDIHVISHSLGGHVAGYAGAKLLGRIARITAIDPMSLYFSGTDEMVRLDTSDAKFVEVIHSNSDILTNLGLGMSEAIGHVDLYPNGGSKQPGCQDTLGSLITSLIKLLFLDFDGAISTRACSHSRAAHFYAESVSNSDSCPFVSFPCDNYGDFEKGNCYQDCSESGKCTSLGYNSKKRGMSANGIYYLRTTDGGEKNNNTYCKQVAQVQIPVSLNQQKTKGSLSLKFVGIDGSSSEMFDVAKSDTISPGQVLQLWVEIPGNILRNPEDKPKISLRYSRGLLQSKTLELESLYVKVIKPDMTTLTTVYNGAVLDTGIDTVVSA